MTYRDALKRAVATFVAGALTTLPASAVLDVAAWKLAAAAGIAAVANLAGRSAQAWLDGHQ